MVDKELQKLLTNMQITLGRIEEHNLHHANNHIAINKTLDDCNVSIKGSPGNPGLETRQEVVESTIKRWERISVGIIITIVGILIEIILVDVLK